MAFNPQDIKYVKPKDLFKTIGVNYLKYSQYIPQDKVAWAERYAFIENYLDGNADPSYLKARMTGKPILNRYAILEYTNVDGDEYDILLETLVITYSESKNIVETNIQGVDGTTKEYVNNGDGIITITGSFMGPDAWHYDDEYIGKFIEMMRIKDSIIINNQYLNELFNVSNIVVYDWDLVQSPELSNIVFYKISAKSNTDDNQIIIR